MSRRDNYIVSKANYSLRKKHLNTSMGSIIEEDYSTIQPMEGFFADDEYAFPESIFKFKIAGGANPKKRHVRGSWDKWEFNGKSGEDWTLNSTDKAPITDETKIALKPNYTSISDFACYGSAYNLIEGSINDIAARFPGSLFLTDKSFNYITEEKAPLPLIKWDGKVVSKEFFVVSNESQIDIDTVLLKNDESVEHPLKYLSISGDKYEGPNGESVSCTVIKNEEDWCVETIVAEVELTVGNKKHKILVYYYDGKKILLTEEKPKTYELLIRPKKEVLEAFFDDLDDFEKVLLNRDTNPPYRAVFETVSEDEDGNHYKNEIYTWPTLFDGVSLDFSSAAFSVYYNKLERLAEWHDTLTSDNIWRSLTHASLKNLDWTFFRNKDGEVDDLSTIDDTRLSMISRIYGRSYDDLMRNANNIKYCNSVSYNEKNNIPDYFLSDVNDISGWEIVNVSPTTDNDLETEPLYKAYSKGNTGYDANINFLRRLKLNSKYINTLKGTRRGIETLLGLFGYDEDDYSIEEYITVASDFPDYETVAEYNSMKESENSIELLFNPLTGIPVARAKAGNGVKDYVFPWFDKTADYDGEMYFQMKGGWGASDFRNINLDESISQIKKLEGGTYYDETLQYMKFAETIDEMLGFSEENIRNGDVCYVTDITGLVGYSGQISNTPSHYFILKDRGYSTTLGKDVESGCWGWKNVDKTELETGKSSDAEKVLYLESILNIEDGNNPHCGYGEYDNGEEYLNRYLNLFKSSIDNDMFVGVDDETVDKIREVGFKLQREIDNKKVHWFEDSTEEKNVKAVVCQKQEYSLVTDEGVTDEIYSKLYNHEDKSKKNDEAAAFSAMNVKNLKITFKTNSDLEEERNYLINIVLPYVKQVIPSTTIFEYQIVKKEADGTIKKKASPANAIEGASLRVMKGSVDGVINDNDSTAIMLEDVHYDENKKVYVLPICDTDGTTILGKDCE